ncbi:helix-turn-helix transcriptional regulator [Lachnospiraceae bacterium 62-35]
MSGYITSLLPLSSPILLPQIQRLDIDILKRLCYVLECSLTDLIEYIPPEETQTLQ